MENSKEITPELGFPIVGIGASAGGLSALQGFFSAIDAENLPNMAYVIIQHLSPDYKSNLPELIQLSTKLKVFQVTNGVKVQNNCIYVIPPKHEIKLIDDKLVLLEPRMPRGQRLPIDLFFHSLAISIQDRAIAVILSGTGSDGSIGIRTIKAEGGLVIIQKLESCEFNGMPNAALATGFVDFELLPTEIPELLNSYAHHKLNLALNQKLYPLGPREDRFNILNKIFTLLRSHTGHDFSQYKPNTINRRIERRMAVNHISEIVNYSQFLQKNPTEIDALFRDILIGVTNYFRDPEVFDALEEKIIPQLFIGRQPKSTIRIWSAGCSTGEEAYSIAILLIEQMEKLKQNFQVQIFATDLDQRSIELARTGIYPESIASDISPERLARFFSYNQDNNTYKIQKNIRDLLVFSEQDLIKDPPFSKLDLISCRNVLIYFGHELQEKLVHLFHFALNPGGILFLGTSEGGGEFKDLFTVVDSKAKFFKRKDHFPSFQRTPVGRFLPNLLNNKSTHPLVKPNIINKFSLKEITEKALMNHLISAGVLVNGQGNILYLHGRTGMYLELSPGEVGVNNILKMAREGLRASLTSAFNKVVATNESVSITGLSVKNNNHFFAINLFIQPIPVELNNFQESIFYLIIFEETPQAKDRNLTSSNSSSDFPEDTKELIASLEQELRVKDEYLLNIHQELENYTEELKSSNEEMQSVNEELQSTNEELETSKEELQSVNEELNTVNSELNSKVLDMTRLNNDMNNLLAGSGIATVFIDHKLRILRFTPTAAQIINLIPGDIGRPVGHIASNLVNYNSLETDVNAVLNTLTTKETIVKSNIGKVYTMRIMPYRTLDNIIEGAVITFIDITEMKKFEMALAEANAHTNRLAAIVNDAYDAILVLELNGNIIAWNPGAMRLYGYSESEALKLTNSTRIPIDILSEDEANFKMLIDLKIIPPYRSKRIAKNGVVINVWVTATALLNPQNLPYAIALTEKII